MEKNKNDKETHDFMNVESFSQLPFTRSCPSKEKGIRLFGKEFGGSDGGTTDWAAEVAINDSDAMKDNENEDKDNNTNRHRRFECHYCCRNFPTSQALGGHQNAHKRERQQAKRHHLTLHHNSSSSVHNIYGGFNYKLASGSAPPTPSMAAYPSWNNSLSSNGRFYGNQELFSQPPLINGGSLGLGRIPFPATVQNKSCDFNRDRSLMHQLPMFTGDELPPSQVVVGGSSSQSRRYVYEPKPSVRDHVSLDLHL